MAAETHQAVPPPEQTKPRHVERERDVTGEVADTPLTSPTAVGTLGPMEEIRQLAEALPQLVWTTRPDGYCEWFNGRWYAFTGSTPDRACGEGWVSGLHPDDRDRALERWRHALATGDPYEVECRLLEAASGAHRWFLGRALPLRGEGTDGRPGPILRWFGTWTDIHEQRLARERAEQLQQVTAALARSLTPDHVAGVVVERVLHSFGAHAGAVLVLTPDGEALTVLRAAGYPAEALAGWAHLPLGSETPLAQAVRAGTTVVVESARTWGARYARSEPLRTAAGSRSWAAVPLVAGGRPVGALALAFDRETAVASSDLPYVETLAGQCAQALERARLFEAERTAREQAEQASRAKGDFLAVMSHELRTPLNAIAGYAQLIEEGVHGPVTDAQREALGRIRRAQGHLLSIINDILRYAKLDAGHVEYDVAVADLTEVLADVGAMVAAQARDKGLAYDVRLPAGPCLVWADRDKLTRVLVNLLSNAVKFTERGGRIEVDVLVRPDAPERVGVRVCDTGIGIAGDMLDAVFEPFVQADGSRAREHEGTGLGLAIGRELARGMGGDVTVHSAPGEGATFTVTLRRAVDDGGASTDRRGRGRRRAERRSPDDRRGEAE